MGFVVTRIFMSNWSRLVTVALSFLSFTVTDTQAQTLDAVRERGFLICASANSLPGFSQKSETGLWSGFDVDFCRAVAAAVLDDPDLVEFRPLQGESRIADLQTGAVDLLARGPSWSLQRDIANRVNVVATSFYDGQAFMVSEASGLVSAFEFGEVSICIIDDADEMAAVDRFFFQSQTNYESVVYEAREDLAVAYAAGLCDAVSAPSRWLHALRHQLPDPTLTRILPERLSKEPFGPVVRAGDDSWANIVRWTFFTLINADELGINSMNLETMLEVNSRPIQRFLGADPKFKFGEPMGLENDWMLKVIRAVGNYEEMYDRNFGPQTGVALPRGQNSLWSEGGLIYAPPLL